ncbi:S24 family peptidase [Methylocystis parvus]|uniref:S24 family peptidase n=1 Tax=Methylocystis parvus TaxID=134 RepID=UPI0012FCA2C6|nr:S24 family peptidase [Methylocystis parvus]WBK01435.1 S24 family peptidase [Methylocystis parvus OBBP]
MSATKSEHLQEFAERVRALVAPYGSIAKAAKALEIPENTLRRACAGRNEPQAPLLMALSTKLDVSMSYLLGLSDDPAVASSPGAASGAELQLRRIPSLDACVAAGRGAAASAVAIDQMLAFPQWMLRKLAPPGARLSFMRAEGDSMQPLFNDGALLLVDESDATLRDAASKTDRAAEEGAIYAFEQAGALRVKRLRKTKSGDIVVISANPAYDPELLTGADAKRIKLLGRIVWWDNRL